jgi:hypothetical protein
MFHLQYKKCNAFYIGCSWSVYMDTGPLVWSWTLPTGTHQCPIPSAPFPGTLVCPCHSQTPWCHYWPLPPLVWNGINPASLPVSTSDNLTRLPPIPLPFSPLAAPANIMVSLPLQLMKATVLGERSCFHLYLSKLLWYL